MNQMKRRTSLAAALAVVIVSACGGKVSVDLSASGSTTGGGGSTSSSNVGGGGTATSTSTSAGGGVSSSSSGGVVDAGVIDAGSGGGVPEGGVIDAGDDAGVIGPGTALRTSIASASYVSVPGLAIPHDFTLEIWAQPDSLAGADQMLLTKEQAGVGQNQFRFGLTGGRLYFMMCDAALQGDMWTPDEGYALISPPLTAGVWTHAAVVKTGTAFILYVNGVKVSSYISPVDLVHTGAFPFEIASRVGGDGFSGVVDEIRVWNIARAATEIAADMGKTIPPTHPAYGSLVAYYRLDDGSGAIASDTKGMYPGDLVNGPTWVLSTAPTGY